MKLGPRSTLGVLLCAMATARGSRASDPLADADLPLAARDRPFLLLDVPRRFSPTEPAAVRVQLREGGTVTLDVFKVTDPTVFERDPIARDGVSIARSALGVEAEALMAAAGALPRVGSGLTLVSERRVELTLPAVVRRNVHDEAPAYDSNEQDEGSVETFGVHANGWTDQRVTVGTLATGVYLVRAHLGAWAATALLPVGEVTLLARRGDHHDTVRVTDTEGRAIGNVSVEARSGGALDCSAQTDAHGEARCPATDAPERRFVARRGDDHAWADVTHSRMSVCDPRVYLATGRPVFRIGEEVHVRGQLRSCLSGQDAALSNEPLRLWFGADGEHARAARSDADGNFTAVLPAGSRDMVAEIRGIRHQRTILIDGRSLPRHELFVRLDRAWAASGETVHVRVGDATGRWPEEATVELTMPGEVRRIQLGPDRSADASFVVPRVTETLTRLSVHARLQSSGETTFASSDVWVGRSPSVIALTSIATESVSGAILPVHITARELGGGGLAGPVELRVYGTDGGGNARRGEARWSGRGLLGASGESQAEVTLVGEGPWWIEALRDGATATMVEWERRRPMALSARGPLAVQPSTRSTTPGARLAVDVRVPEGGGSTWLTLEQGSVWSSVEVPEVQGGGTVRVELQVPVEARGMASLVATRVHGAEVTTASSAAEVESARRVELTLRADPTVYAKGATAHIEVNSRTPDGAPRDGVLTVWMADAGYWELGTESYPSPGDFFRMPGRRASAGDSTHPRGYGAEEGRRMEAFLEWNTVRIDETSFRHGWGHPGELVSFEKRGTFEQVAQDLARNAGLRSAVVCAARVREFGVFSLRARMLPWDLVAERVATRTRTNPYVRDHVLHFGCEARPVSLGGSGMGSGGGAGYGRGSGSGIGSRSQRLEGTLFFLPLRRIGPSGHTVVDVPLPDHPGRWRVEALVIADDGGGASAHAVVTTTQTVTGRIDVPTVLGEGDLVRAQVAVSAPTLAGRELRVRVSADGAVSLASAAPERVTLDARGEGSAAGDGRVRLILGEGPDQDDLSQSVRVRSDGAVQPLSMRAFVGPVATDVDIPIPELSGPAEIVLTVDGSLGESVARVLESLRATRWNVGALRIDRLASLNALRRALSEGRVTGQTTSEITREITSEMENIAALRGSDGGASWWSRMPSSPRLSAELLWELGAHARDARWSDMVAGVRAAAVGAPSPERPMYAAALMQTREPGDRALAQRILAEPSGRGQSLEALTWELRAAHALGDASRVSDAARRLDSELYRTMTVRGPIASCRGVAWFLCMARYGDQAAVARAANALLIARAESAGVRAASVLGWYSTHPVSALWFDWGTEESDVVELEARLQGTSVNPRFEVFQGALSRGTGDPEHPLRVSVRDAGVLRASFSAQPGRALRFRVEGSLPLAPVTLATGPSGLTRSLVPAPTGLTLLSRFTLARPAERVELSIPLAAGLDLATATGDRDAVRASLAAVSFSWDMLDRSPDAPPAVEIRDGVLRVRFRHLGQGLHTVRVPLTRVARGTFRMGSAWLRAADASEWSVTPGVQVEL